MELNILFNEIEKHSIISFDVFDTLLLRPFVRPEDLFQYIEYKYSINGFSHARSRVTVNDKKEKTIEDIYDNISREYRNIKDIELREEERTIYANSLMKEVFQFAVNKQKTIVIVSDIYFHDFFIDSLLKKNGINGYKKIFCSCDYQKTKCSGELFDELLDVYKVKPNQILHIGDNKISDFTVPKSKKIDAFLIEKTADSYFRYRDYLNGNVYDFWDSFILKNCADNYVFAKKYDDETKRCWYRFGYDLAGPICWTFSKWIVKELDGKEEITDIAFVARDGYLIKKMYDNLQKDINVKSHYVYAPRILATLLQETYHRIEKQELQRAEKKLIDKVYGIADYDKERRMAFINDVAAGYKRYLESEFSVGGEKIRIGVVDSTSNNLSSQKLIENFTNNATCGFYWYVSEYAHLLDFETKTYQKEHYGIVNSVDLFELIFKSPESNIKFLNKNGEVIFDDDNVSERQRIKNFSFIEEGAMDFFNDVEEKELDGFPLASTINNYLNRFCENPIEIERKIFETGMVSGGIANSEWTATKIYSDVVHKKRSKCSLNAIKSRIANHPKLFIMLRKMYHFIKGIK